MPTACRTHSWSVTTAMRFHWEAWPTPSLASSQVALAL
jgi:hypothetical protein